MDLAQQQSVCLASTRPVLNSRKKKDKIIRKTKKKKKERKERRRQIAMNICPQMSLLYIVQDSCPGNARNGTNHSGLVLLALLTQPN